jgi:hypothetical protein
MRREIVSVEVRRRHTMHRAKVAILAEARNELILRLILHEPHPRVRRVVIVYTQHFALPAVHMLNAQRHDVSSKLICPGFAAGGTCESECILVALAVKQSSHASGFTFHSFGALLHLCQLLITSALR